MVDESRFHGYEPKVSLVQSTDNPLEIVTLAANMTMFKTPTAESKDHAALIKRLLHMNHTSLFEHVFYTFQLENVTRSLLAQITRHRICSFTAGSQHYQHYADYDFSINEKWKDNVFVLQAVDEAMTNYKMLRRAGCPKEEARQVLPGGMHVNILWTINARSLINFLNLRLCERNVEEIRIVADEVYNLVLEHFPELFEHVGPDCEMDKCRQGKMSCGRR